MASPEIKLPLGWRAHKSTQNGGRTYFYNYRTKESCWHFAEVLDAEAKEKAQKAKHAGDRPVKPFVSPVLPISRKRKSSFDSCKKSKGLRIEDSLPSSGYGNSLGTPSAASTSDEMEVCESVLDDSTVMMEIDDLRQNFRQVFDEPNSEDLKKFSAIKEISTYCSAEVQRVYVVIDTNVLLTNLKLLDTLVLLSEDKCKVILIIPWIVLQELDELKDDRRSMKNVQVHRQARAAIRFLHTQLSDTASSIQGQSIEQATRVTSLIASTNDDHILLCCTDFHKRANSSAILLTNDKNLCNKASSNRCLAFCTDTIYDKLSEIIANPSICSAFEQEAEEKRDYPERTASEIYNSFKLTLFETLSFVLEKVMCLVYDEDKWLSIIKIKPPWNLTDVFICIDKHWIAVFNCCFLKEHKMVFNSLREFFANDKGRKETFSNINSAIDQSLRLCQHLKKRQLNDDLTLPAPVPAAFNIKLSRQIEKLSCLSVEFKLLVETSEKQRESIADSIVANAANLNIVRTIFCDVASRIDGLCASVAHHYGLEYRCDRPLHVLTQSEVATALTEFYGFVKNLYRQLSLVVGNPDLKEDDVMALCEAIKAFYRSENEGVMDEFSHNILHSFCVIAENKEYLKQGMCEVHALGNFLQQCNFRNIRR